MTTNFNDFPLVKNNDTVGSFGYTETMGYKENGFISEGHKIIYNFFLCQDIKTASSFV